MILTVTSLKGGVGKTTVSGLFALYLARCRQAEVILIDLDPQMGSTALVLGQKPEGTTVYDLIQAVRRDEFSGALFRQALHPSPFDARIFLLPGDPRLITLESDGTPPESLQILLEAADLPQNTPVLIDTGTQRSLVGMGIEAAGAVLIPLMLSQQAIKPTANTLSMIQRQGKPLLGLMPVEGGGARWEAELLAGWARTLTTRFDALRLLLPDDPILPALPYSRHLIRGRWVASGFPDRFLAIFQTLEKGLVSTSLPEPGAAAI